jgi:hypothetical protein
VLEVGVALRRLFALPVGDQALFARRSAYFAAGGASRGEASWPVRSENLGLLALYAAGLSPQRLARLY